MRLPDWVLGLLPCVLLASCASSALELAPEKPDRPWVPARTADGEIIPGPASSSDGSGYVLAPQASLGIIPDQPDVDPAKIYSLAELIDLAESNNPTTRIAWNEARRVALAAGKTESAYLPQITASAIAGYEGSHGSDAAGGRSFDTGGSGEGTVLAVSLQWLLFDFGERAAIHDAAMQASVLSNIAFTAAHQQLIYDVSLAFYDHGAARARVRTASQSLRNAKAVQAAAEDRYRKGIGTVIEVAQARQATAESNLAVVRADGGAQDSYFTLLAAMGISPLTKIRVAELSGRNFSPGMAKPVDSIIRQALARRPDVQSAYAAQKASLANVKAAEAEFLPKFFLSATGTYNAGRLNVTALPAVGQQSPTVNINTNRAGGSVFTGATLPLYDAGVRAATLAQSRAEADNAEARMTRVRQNAVQQIAVAENALRTSLSAHAASEALSIAAHTTFEAALAAYRNGVGPITDVNMAESQLLQSSTISTDTYYAVLSSAATLALATGVLGTAPE